MKNFLHREKFFVIFLIILSTLYSLSLFVDNDPWWDSSVYLGMGKYIFSFGESGLWEASRPLMWPVVLGLFWKLGLDPVLFGKITVILSSLGILVLTFLLAERAFGRKVAFASSLILSIFPTFFLFTGVLHAEIPSTFLFMLGLYYFVVHRYKLSGIILGLAFMSRFFQIFGVLALGVYMLYLIHKKKMFARHLFEFSLFFLIPVIPYLVLNYLLYGHPLYSFLLQQFMTQNTGWIFHQPWDFYFLGLFNETVLVIFSVIGFLYFWRKPNKDSILIFLVLLFQFVPYNLTAHKEMRLLIAVLPFLAMFISYGIFQCLGNFRKRNYVAYALIVAFVILTVPKLQINNYDDNLDIFRDYVLDIEPGSNVYISNPSFVVDSDLKAELIYYPLYSSEKIVELKREILEIDEFLLNSCDILPCPAKDQLCAERHYSFLLDLEKSIALKFMTQIGECTYSIYSAKV